jgi:hypothetical protein
MEFTFQPRLTKGRHMMTTDESGPFCLVEALGFNVDGKVHDEHPSIDRVLAAAGRTLNDRMCKHYSHPIAEAAGLLAPHTSEICDECQGRLWAFGKRIAGTGYAADLWTESELAAVHVDLALTAAETVLRVIPESDPLRVIVSSALTCARLCTDDPTEERRAAARLEASRIDQVHVKDAGSTPAAWAACAATHAIRAAAAILGNDLGDLSTTYFFANRRCIEAMTYAFGATEGDPAASMRVARKVVNAFEKATSRNETPGVSDDQAQACVQCGALAAPLSDWCAQCGPLQEEEYDHDGADAHAAADRVLNGYPNDPDMAARLERACAAAELADQETAAEDAADAAYAEAATQEHDYYTAAAPCPERTTFDGKVWGCVKLNAHVEHISPLGTAWFAKVPVHPAVPDVIATAVTALLGADDEEVNDFDESEIGDVADEAIGDLHRVEARAESILRAVAEEHRAAEVWVRKDANGTPTEYRERCCVVCRDAAGRPVPAPCRTMIIINGY